MKPIYIVLAAALMLLFAPFVGAKDDIQVWTEPGYFPAPGYFAGCGGCNHDDHQAPPDDSKKAITTVTTPDIPTFAYYPAVSCNKLSASLLPDNVWKCPRCDMVPIKACDCEKAG